LRVIRSFEQYYGEIMPLNRLCHEWKYFFAIVFNLLK
jgi:hypothetical protein